MFDGQAKYYVDPYCYALPFVVRKRFWFPRLKAWWTGQPRRYGLVEFTLVIKVMTPCQYRALREALRAEGWGVLSTRVKNGIARTTEVCKRRRRSAE